MLTKMTSQKIMELLEVLSPFLAGKVRKVFMGVVPATLDSVPHKENFRNFHDLLNIDLGDHYGNEMDYFSAMEIMAVLSFVVGWFKSKDPRCSVKWHLEKGAQRHVVYFLIGEAEVVGLRFKVSPSNFFKY